MIHWLLRPATVRKLWIALYGILALTLVPELFMQRHSSFGLDAGFGFFAWFGLLSCIAMILVAKALALLLKRPDTYYDE